MSNVADFPELLVEFSAFFDGLFSGEGVAHAYGGVFGVAAAPFGCGDANADHQGHEQEEYDYRLGFHIRFSGCAVSRAVPPEYAIGAEKTMVCLAAVFCWETEFDGMLEARVCFYILKLRRFPMKLRVFIAVFFVCAALPGFAADGFVPLFDGKTLQGWEILNGSAKYEVADGMIVGTTVAGSPNSFLCTTRPYGDFILEYEAKVDLGLNSGVQIRSSRYERDIVTRIWRDGEAKEKSFEQCRFADIISTAD